MESSIFNLELERSTMRFQKIIPSKKDFRTMVPAPSDLVVAKEISFLDVHCKTWIARSPFVLIATANDKGQCDVSPRGDAAGFVQVLDDKHLAIPDRPGNKRFDTFENIFDNPHVGLLFLIPGLRETLRVNGKATLIQDDDVLDKATVDGKRPLFAIGVEVEQAFIHCAKAFIRSGLWKPDTWQDSSGFPSLAKMLLDHVEANKKKVDINETSLDETIAESYKTRLY
ncbi:MAG: pyridoxamine 5'-phosphate oxidase family protein [Trueperaceae bacterium]